jgi:hypothetical protein
MRFAFVLSMLLQTGATIFGNQEYRSLGVRLADPIDHPRRNLQGCGDHVRERFSDVGLNEVGR